MMGPPRSCSITASRPCGASTIGRAMQTIKLLKETKTYHIDVSDISWYVASNWPFRGVHEWSEGHRCECGNRAFAVTYARVEVRGTAGEESTWKDVQRIVCASCVRFRPGEWIVGEIDFASMVATVYDTPREAPRASTVITNSAMNECIPHGVYYSLRDFDENSWRPDPAAPVESPAVEVGRPVPAARRSRKFRPAPDDPMLGGFDDEDAKRPGAFDGAA